MKNLLRFLGITAFVAVIGFVAASCSNGTTGGGPFNPGDPGVQRPVVPLKETYVSYDADGNEYKLVITEATGRALGRALDPNKNYTYTLTITFVNGTKATSTGTVVINTDETDAIVSIDLKHTGTGTTITVTVSGSADSDTGAITKIKSESGTIPVNNGSTLVPIPTALPYTLNQTDIGGKGYIITNGESFIINGVVNNIPETFRGLPVMGIGWAAFANNKDLRSITIPASITHIAWWGNFEGCTNLATVTFAVGSKLELIGGGAFTNCTSLTSITIPASVTDISGWGNFDRCTNLKTVTFESGSKLQIIGAGAFVDCTSLSAIEIPASVTTLKGWGTFAGCTSLTTVTFAPNSQLKTICYGDEAGGTFFNCKSLKNITIPAGLTHIGPQAFQGSGITSITFAPNSQLETIGNIAFYECVNLSEIIIPAGVTSIGWGAFNLCKSLTTVTFASGSQLKTIGNNAFANCTSISAITIPAGVTNLGYMVFESWEFSQTINVYHANRTAASAAWGDWLGDCGAVIKYWNGNAFEEPGLEYELNYDGTGYRVIGGPRRGAVNIPATYNGKPVTEIGDDAFFNSTGITSVTIPESVTFIGNNAFANCTGLTSIIIPASVSGIGGALFPGCINLTDITVAAGSPYYTSENGILYSEDKTTLVSYPSASGTVTIPTNVQVIGWGAFGDCTKLTSIIIPSSVSSIEGFAFMGCTSITSITIPSSVTSIDMFAFHGWSASQTINIQGHASQAAADEAWAASEWDGNNWRSACDAKINYNG